MMKYNKWWLFKKILFTGCVALAHILNRLHLISRPTHMYIAQEARWFFLEYSTLPQEGQISPGIGIVYKPYAFDGVSQVGNDFVDMLKQLNLPVQCLDISNGHRRGQVLSSYVKIQFLTEERHKENAYYNIITPFWEFQSGMTEYRPLLFDGVDEALVFSDFCYNYFRNVAPREVRISKVRYPLTRRWNISQSPEKVRTKYGVKDEDFLLFFHFNFGSSYHRKNPEAILRAFALALGDKINAKVMIKTIGFQAAKHNVIRLNNLARELNIHDSIIFINEYLSYDNIINLINASDTYISLHRGEGFGIGMLEAMALGKPVIATNYGGNTEFTRADTALLVDYKLVKPSELDHKAYRWVSSWAEPNIENAASHLLTLYNNQSYGIAIAKSATAFINEHFRPDNFKNDIKHLINNVNISKRLLI